MKSKEESGEKRGKTEKGGGDLRPISIPVMFYEANK